MFNELKRIYNQQVYYLFDSICDIIQSIIFIVGILLILKDERIEIFYFLVIYVSVESILSNNNELEYEIRTNQYESLLTNKVSIYKVYFSRLVANFIVNTFVFMIGMLLFQIFNNDQIFIKQSSNIMKYVIVYFINAIIFYVINIVVIWLTQYYKRISVMLSFFNYFILFFSGMIFPVKFFTYKNFLDMLAYKIVNIF